MESVVDGLKKVIDTKSKELERLHKHGVSTTKYAELQNNLRDAKRKISKMRTEIQSLKESVRVLENDKQVSKVSAF